jgi:hypothetical protein
VKDFDDLVQSIKSIAVGSESLNQQAVLEYTPVVEGILRCRSRDAQYIERTLDGLLDFCSVPEILLLYKHLCRHYYALDPAAATDYVRAYRDMWDSGPEAQS